MLPAISTVSEYFLPSLLQSAYFWVMNWSNCHDHLGLKERLRDIEHMHLNCLLQQSRHKLPKVYSPDLRVSTFARLLSNYLSPLCLREQGIDTLAARVQTTLHVACNDPIGSNEERTTISINKMARIYKRDLKSKPLSFLFIWSKLLEVFLGGLLNPMKPQP